MEEHCGARLPRGVGTVRQVFYLGIGGYPASQGSHDHCLEADSVSIGAENVTGKRGGYFVWLPTITPLGQHPCLKGKAEGHFTLLR